MRASNESDLVSVIIPARNEVYLQKTVEDVFAHSTGPVEIVAVIEGDEPPGWTQTQAVRGRRLMTVHHPKPLGMRPAINAGVLASHGRWIVKCDAHVRVSEGWDEILKRDCDEEAIMIPRRYELNPETWEIKDAPAVDAHRLTYPFSDEYRGKLHATKWPERGKERAGILIDEEISSQGSFYLTSRKLWDRIGPLDGANYRNIVNEAEELCFRTWLGGGRVLVNRGTFYAHWTKVHHRGYSITRKAINAGYDFCFRYWTLDEWKDRIHDLQWLIEKFSPPESPMPGWPSDLDEVFRHARAVLKPTGTL